MSTMAADGADSPLTPEDQPRAPDQRVTTLATAIESRIDITEKCMIALSIVLGAATTIAAGLNQQSFAVCFAALTTATISAQHWFALAPRAKNSERARMQFQILKLRLDTRQIKLEEATKQFETIEEDYVGGKPSIGSTG